MLSPDDLLALHKAELHAHLNGCIPPSTVRQLVTDLNVQLPDGFDLDKDLVVQTPRSSLLEYFRPWHVLKRLPVGRDCLRAMVSEALRSLASDNVKYAELRNSPYNIAQLNSISLDDSLRWLIDCFDEFSDQHSVDARLIVSFSRYQFDLQRASDLLDAVRRTNTASRIVGIDLSGNEDDPVPPDVSALFLRAKNELGLGVSIHAGETGSPENIIWAVQQCKADRIGHGLAAATDQRAMEHLIACNVCIEIALKSSLLTGRVTSLDQHPVHAFVENGVPFVLCSDNPQIHDFTLTQEYGLFQAMTSRDDLVQGMYQRQRSFCFDHRR